MQLRQNDPVTWQVAATGGLPVVELPRFGSLRTSTHSWVYLAATYPLLPHPAQTLAREALGELIPPRAALAGVASASLGAGPSDARDADGLVKGSHLLLKLKQSESEGKRRCRHRKQPTKSLSWVSFGSSYSQSGCIGGFLFLYPLISNLIT